MEAVTPRTGLLSVVLPAYNEEESVPLAARTIGGLLAEADIPYELLFVNDGSRDHTWQAIQKAAEQDPRVRGIRFSRNFGKEAAIFEVLKAYIKESKPIRFDGNGYSDEWKEEAAKRGLDCQNSVPLQYDAYLKPESIEMFTSTGVLTQKELEARNEVKWEVYIKKVQIEARVLGDLSLNHIIPVAVRYQSVLLDNIAKLKETFGDDPEFRDMSEEPRRLVRKIAGHICAVTKKVDEMVEARKKANRLTDMREKAIAYHDSVAPYLDEIRDHIDDLELMVDNQMWPLPKYRELLFIR